MNGKDKITKMNNMEIKVGDKVRVSEDAPRVYTRGLWEVFEKRDSNVDSVEDGTAVISTGPHIIAIPLKYLVKVDAEAFRLADVVSDAGLHQDNYLNEDKKKAKIKLGDMVRVKGNLHEPFCLNGERHLEFHNIHPRAVSQKEWEVVEVESRRDCAEHIYTLKHGDSFIYNIPEDCVELVEPTEPTEADKKPNVGSIKIPVEVDLSDSYWDAYAADLAKEIALKVAKKLNDPEQTAEYAVSVAKAVAEGLKRK